MRLLLMVGVLSLGLLAESIPISKKPWMAKAIWSVWYDDGSGLQRFHSAKNTWSDIPGNPGVQVVLVCEESPYRRVIHGSNWYWIDDRGVPQTSGNDGFPDGRWQAKPYPSARAGLTIDDDRFERYRLAALEDKTCAALEDKTCALP